jgi:phosphonate transport system substrate-binding protein
MKSLLTAFVLIITLAISGCQSKGSVDSNGMPKTLVIGMVESEKLPQIKDAREKIRLYLQKKLGMPVEMIYTNDYVGVIEALRANKIHMAELPPFAYVIATRSIKLTPIVTLGANGKPVSYESVIIVKGDSKIKTMADVKAQAKKLTFCFVDPASTSGHLIPRAFLVSYGLNPDTAFKQTIFAGSHPASILSVKSGKIDVGCTTDLIFNIMIQNHMMKEGDVRVIWKSAPIVSDPIVVRNDINPELTKKIQQAYLDLNKEEPGILKDLLEIVFKDTVTRSYMVANDSLFNGLRKIANGVKGLNAN